MLRAFHSLRCGFKAKDRNAAPLRQSGGAASCSSGKRPVHCNGHQSRRRRPSRTTWMQPACTASGAFATRSNPRPHDGEDRQPCHPYMHIGEPAHAPPAPASTAAGKANGKHATRATSDRPGSQRHGGQPAPSVPGFRLPTKDTASDEGAEQAQARLRGAHQRRIARTECRPPHGRSRVP